jgi:hypothetical protein
MAVDEVWEDDIRGSCEVGVEGQQSTTRRSRGVFSTPIRAKVNDTAANVTGYTLPVSAKRLYASSISSI